MTRIKVILLGVLLLGFVLRFYNLGQVPVSLHRDEAFLGYNAYSILKTGSDISGNFLPLHLESFLFSPAGYSYLSIPFISLFGLSEFSIRFASAFFGFFTILLVYLLTKYLFDKNKNRQAISLFSSFIFAISPWHINLSRTATENTIATFLITLGGLLFVLWLRNKKNWFLFSSFVSFFVTLLIYQAPRAFLPLFLPFITFSLGFKKIVKKDLVLLSVLLALILIPVMFIVTSPDLSYRIRTLNIFQHPQTEIMVTSWLIGDGMVGLPQELTRPFHNKLVGYSHVFLENYFSHLSPSFLFFDKGLPDRYRVPQMGLLYLFEIALLFVSITYLVKKNLKIFIFLLGWILISFVGSALTFDDIPNLQRSLTAAPAFSILSGLGLFIILDFVKEKKHEKHLRLGIYLVIALSVGFYLVQYYSYSKVYRTWYRQDGYKELVAKVNSYKEDYREVLITNRETAPTIFFLFFNKYDPSLFQKETSKIDLSKSDYANFSDYKFTDEECPVRVDNLTKRITGEKGILYVNSGLCKDVEGSSLIYTVRRTDGSPAFKIVEIN
jgi:4-amino-4-deoxy-L-arabinose transferase-like glycosyltransferase